MGSQRARMASTTVFLFFATFLVPLLSQTKFSDPQKTKDVDKKIFTGDPTLDTLGGGLIGVGLGALGASVLGPTIGQVLGGGNTGFGSQTSGGCGRRKRQADGETRRQLHLRQEEKTGFSQGEGGAKHKVLWKLVWGKRSELRGLFATVKAITKALATTREITTRGTTKAATTRAAQTREVGANVTTTRHSLTRMEGHMGPAEGLITPGAPGAIQLVGATLGVVTYSLQKGFQTTPGLTELVHSVDSYSNFLQCMVCFTMLT